MIKSTNGNVEIEVNRGGITKTLTLKVSTVRIKSVIKINMINRILKNRNIF